MDTKTSAEMVQNWTAAIPGVATKYGQGIDKNTTWHNKAMAGQTTYESAMMNPTVLQRRLSGLQNKTSQTEWKTRSKEVGGPRIASGMTAGTTAFQSAAGLIISTLQGLTLPDRTGDAMQNIDNRVKPIAQALQSAFGKV
jgi:hypothetical protein